MERVNFVRLWNEYNPVKLNKFKSKSTMEIEIEKELHSYKQRIFKDFFYWLNGTWFIVAIVFTLYGIFSRLDITALYIIIAYLIIGFFGRAYFQRFNLKRIYICNNIVTLEFKRYNKNVVHTCSLKEFVLTDYPRGSMAMKCNKFSYIQNNDYYWRIKEIKFLINTFLEYKERSVKFRELL